MWYWFDCYWHCFELQMISLSLWWKDLDVRTDTETQSPFRPHNTTTHRSRRGEAFCYSFSIHSLFMSTSDFCIVPLSSLAAFALWLQCGDAQSNMDSGLISQYQMVGLHLQKPFHLSTDYKNRSMGIFYFLIFFLWACWVWVQTAWAQIFMAMIWLWLCSSVLQCSHLISVDSTDAFDLSWHHVLPQKILFCCSASWCVTPLLRSLQHLPISLPQVPPPDAAGTKQTHPGASHTQPNHLLPTYKLHVCHHWGVVCMVRVHIWASSLRPISCSSTHERVCACVYMHVISSVCVAIGSVCFYIAICVMLPQEELWAFPRKAFGNGFGKASGNVCAKLSDGFVSIMAAFGPGAVTEDQNRELLQRSSRFSAESS